MSNRAERTRFSDNTRNHRKIDSPSSPPQYIFSTFSVVPSITFPIICRESNLGLPADHAVCSFQVKLNKINVADLQIKLWNGIHHCSKRHIKWYSKRWSQAKCFKFPILTSHVSNSMFHQSRTKLIIFRETNIKGFVHLQSSARDSSFNTEIQGRK